MTNFIVGFSENKSHLAIGSKIIKLALGTPYSHVHIKFYSESLDRWLIYQAVGGGVNFCSDYEFITNHNIVQEFDYTVDKDKLHDLLNFCLDESGVPYGRLALIGMGLVLICKKFGKKIKNPFADGNKTDVCSELAARICVMTGILTEEQVGDFDSIDPKELHDLLEN